MSFYLFLILPEHLHSHLLLPNTQAITAKVKESASQYTTTAPMNRRPTNKQEGRTANTGLAKVAVQCSADTFVVNQTLVLRINICGENRHLRQARNRYGQVLDVQLHDH